MQFELPKEDFEALRLQQDAPGRWKYVAALIHFDAINPDGEPVACTKALDPVPLAKRVLDVVLPAGIEQFLEVPIVPGPP